MSECPPKEKITVRWLVDHVPVSFWISLFVIGFVLFSTGVGFGAKDTIASWLNSLSNSYALQREVKELASRLEGRDKAARELSGRVKLIESENKQLRAELTSLKKQLRAKQKPAVSKQKLDVARRAATKADIREIIGSLSNMYSSDVAEFLIDIVPRIKGGVACDDLAVMLGYAWTSEGASVVKRVAPYVQRPFSDGCLSKLSANIYSSDAANAISTLLRSKPKY